MFNHINRKHSKMDIFYKCLALTFFKLIVTQCILLVLTSDTTNTFVTGKELDFVNSTNGLDNANGTIDLNDVIAAYNSNATNGTHDLDTANGTNDLNTVNGTNDLDTTSGTTHSHHGNATTNTNTTVTDKGVTNTPKLQDAFTKLIHGQNASMEYSEYTSLTAITSFEKLEDEATTINRGIIQSTTLFSPDSTNRTAVGVENVTSNGIYFTDKFNTVLPTKMFSLEPNPKLIYYQPTLSDMEHAIEQTDAIEYLSKFTNTFQRTIVRNHLMHCPYYSLCDIDSFAVPTSRSCCTPCDCNIDSCMNSNSCCPSIIPENIFKLQNDTDSGKSKSSRNFKGSNFADTVCVSAEMSHQTGSGLEAISNCRDNDKSHAVDMCTMVYSRESALSDVVPVTSRNSKVVFRNKHCATCNNVLESDMVYFNSYFSCKDPSFMNNLTNSKEAISLSFSPVECDVSFLLETTSIRKCNYIIDKCNVTGNWETYDSVLEMACSLYVSPTYHDGVLYNNVQCVLCNGNIPTVTCDEHSRVRSFIFAFSGLLTLDSTQAIVSEEPPVVKDLQTSCNNNQMFDILFEQCRDLVCSDASYHLDGSCIGLYSAVVANMMYVVDIRLLPQTTITVEEMMTSESDLLWKIYEAFYDIRNRFDTCYLEMALRRDTLYTQRHYVPFKDQVLSYVDIRFKLVLSQMGGPQKPSRIIDSILAMRFNTLNIKRMYDVPLVFQIVFTQFDTTRFNLIELVHNSVEIREALSNKNFLEKLEVLSQYAFPDADGFTTIPTVQDLLTMSCMNIYIAFPVIEYMSCPKIALSRNEIIWTNVLDGLLVDGLKIDRGTFYFIDEEHIMMCFEQYEILANHLLPSRAFNIEMILSIICSSMSIISLLVTILIYAIFPKLHNSLPGHNNMCLSVSLLIAQIMLLVGSISPFDQYSIECKTFGLLIHFSWLCVIFWMNVCTYHLMVSLTRPVLHMLGFNVKKCVSYHLYVLVSSMIFVGLNILISGLKSNTFGYGGKYCYITSQERILITFVAPTILVVLVNLLMFFFMICKVTKKPDVRKSVKHERNDLVIFAKLATLTGISWIFGFLYIWTNISALSYIFTVLNAGQGVFIMVSFVLNRRVFAMFKDLFREWPKKPSSKQFEDCGRPSTSSSIL